MVAQLPVAVVDGGHGAGAHDPFQVVAFVFGDVRHGLFQGHLDLGQRRNGHPDGQIVVQNVVFTEITVGEDEIAQPLGVSEARAMADHQPGMGAQDGDVIGGCFGVRGADADVDQGDAGTVFPFEVEGRHLGKARGGLQRLIGVSDHRVARADKGGIAAGGVGQHLAGVGFEFVDVELVVGEQNVVLEMVGGRGGVVREAGKRIIDPLRGKGGQGVCAVFVGEAIAVDDVVVHRLQLGHIEDVAEREVAGPFLWHGQRSVIGDGEMHRHGGCGVADADGHAVVLDQKAQLLGQIIGEQIGAGDRGGIASRLDHMAKAEAGIGGGEGFRGDAHLGVEGADAAVGLARAHGLAEAVAKKS